MKKNIYILAFSLIVLLSKAQFVITSTANPVAGDKESRINTSTVGLVMATAGTNKLWDYSALQMGSSISSRTFVALTSVPNKSLYPTATIAANTGSQNYDIFNNSSSSRIYLGYAQPTASACTVYNNSMIQLTLPCSYGTLSSDTYSQSGSNYTESGTYQAQGSGTGTLVLPSYTMTNVLMVTSTAFGTLSGSSLNVSYTVQTQEFFCNLSKFSVFSIGYLTVDDGSSVDSDISSSVLTTYAFGVGIEENAFTAENINLYPNPSTKSDFVNIEISGGHVVSDIEVLDITGKKILTRELTGNKTQLDISTLAKGLYTVKVKTDKGSSTRKLVIE